MPRSSLMVRPPFGVVLLFFGHGKAFLLLWGLVSFFLRLASQLLAGSRAKSLGHPVDLREAGTSLCNPGCPVQLADVPFPAFLGAMGSLGCFWD